jgi:uncharacterized protein (TIGR00251 family)
MIHVSEYPEGCVLSVKAHPGARRSDIQGEIGGNLKVAVTAPADRGKANQALLDVLREALGLQSSEIQLIGGFAQRQKKVLIRNCSKAQLVTNLTALLER